MLKSRVETLEKIENMEEMFLLMKGHYKNVDKTRFLKDLREKTGAILLYNEQEEIKGFSTFKIYYEKAIDAWIIFSGDTIIHRDYWGSNALFQGFGSVLNNMMDQVMEKKIYWFLISKGFRTYCMLPLFFRQYWPKVDFIGDGTLHAKLDLIAEARFGVLYDKETGIIRMEEDYLLGDLAGIPDEKGSNRHVRFFLERNPGYALGNELACLTEVNRDNILSGAMRFVEESEETIRVADLQ